MKLNVIKGLGEELKEKKKLYEKKNKWKQQCSILHENSGEKVTPGPTPRSEN